MSRPDIGITPEEAERLCLAGIDNLDLMALGESMDDVFAAADPLEQARGMYLYATMLEAMLMISRGATLEEVRRASRETAVAWRKLPRRG